MAYESEDWEFILEKRLKEKFGRIQPEVKIDILENQLKELNSENEELRKIIRNWIARYDHNKVNRAFHHKVRGNTTLIFEDGHSITVKRAKGDKDSLDTAIAYALAINLCGSRANFHRLVESVKEVK